VREAIQKIANGEIFDDPGVDGIILTPEKLSSLADQSNKVEIARASIDARALFMLAANAIATGDLTGTPLSARDKIDLIKWLGGRVVPEAKSQEMTEVVQRVDRGRKRANEFSQEDLKKLSKTELLDLLE
jgi:uncharacterized coiled-coil DUF342 family protein